MAISGGKLYDGHFDAACRKAAIKPGASSRVYFNAAMRVIAPPISPQTNSSQTAHSTKNTKSRAVSVEWNIRINGRVKNSQIDFRASIRYELADSNTSPTLRADVLTQTGAEACCV